jgi:hypothetical protein
MSDNSPNPELTKAERVLALAAELEASGDAIEGSALQRAQAMLHKWIDSAVQVVTVPALGRVTIIHQDGTESSIAASDLAFALSVPVSRKQDN